MDTIRAIPACRASKDLPLAVLCGLFAVGKYRRMIIKKKFKAVCYRVT